MPRIALVNMVLGFGVLFVSASAGTFIINILTRLFLIAPAQANSWQNTLIASAHGHTSLFAFTHILYALTLPYSKLSLLVKRWQTFGLCAGTLGMGLVLPVKAYMQPSLSFDLLTTLLGLLLTFWLFAIASHAFGIFLRIRRT